MSDAGKRASVISILRDKMAEEKVLGWISSAKYGLLHDRDYLIGLQLEFSGKWGSVGDGGMFLVCFSKTLGNATPTLVTQMQMKVNEILHDAHKNYVHELVGVPVEVIMECNTFKFFRILTEVISKE